MRLILLVLSSMLLCATGCDAVESNSLTTRTVAFIGDGYTSGTPMGGIGPRGWPAIVESKLKEDAAPISADVAASINSGYVALGGDGHSFAEEAAKVVKRKDSLVVLFGSRNDLHVAPNVLIPAIKRTIEQVKTAAPTAQILVIGPPWVKPNPPEGILRIRDILKSAADALGVSFFDPIDSGWFAGQLGLIGPDGIYPNDDGHSYMAGKIAPLISSHLGL